MTQQQMEFYTSKMLIFNRQGNMYQPEAKHEFCLFFANMFPLTPATIFIFISLFVPDTPAFLPAIRNNRFYGRQREVIRRLAAYQLHGKFPLRGSLRAALICCGVYIPKGHLRTTL